MSKYKEGYIRRKVELFTVRKFKKRIDDLEKDNFTCIPCNNSSISF